MRIAIFQMNQLGDMMFSLPMIYNLRKNLPQAYICCISKSPVIVELSSLTTLIDKALIRPIDISKKINFFKICKNENFNLSFHISQSIDSTFMSFLLNIPERIGFDSALFSFLYTTKVPFSNPPSTTNNLQLLESLNMKIYKRNYVGLLEIKPNIEYLQKINIQDSDFIAVISPGTSKRRKYKTWDVKKFSAVANYIVNNYNAKCFIVGTRNDYSICESIVTLSNNSRIYNFAGKTSLKDISQILARANLFVGIDSGLLHLASALSTPVVGLFGKTLPEVIGPQGEKKVIIKKDTTDDISISEVIEAISKL